MRKNDLYFLILFFLLQPFYTLAQTTSASIKVLKQEQESFLRQLEAVSNDSAIIYPLARHYELEINRIYASVTSKPGISADEKEKASRSIVFFMKELRENVRAKKIDMYDIPGALQCYKSILTALLDHKSFTQVLAPMEPCGSQMMTAAFNQYNEYAVLDDIAVYKRVSSAPEYILQFLESKPRYRYADSLLLEAAAYDPLKLVFYLKKANPAFQERIRKSKNKYLQEIVALSEDRNVSELLPFVAQISEKKLTPEEILEKRKDVTAYFQLLVNTLRESIASRDSSSIFLKTLREGVRQKALYFFANQLNELHNSSDAVRFASVKGLRPEDLYYIITTCSDELYTSSYLGLYKRLMAQFKDQNADALFDLVQYDNFGIFIRSAANYNVLADFLQRMPEQSMNALVKRFITGIEIDAKSGLERAMDIADSFTGLDATPQVAAVMHSELRSNMNRCTSQQNYLGMRLYNILLEVFELVKQEHSLNRLWAKLGNYEVLKKDALINSEGEIVQVVLFYGDEDGTASFNNFLRQYNDSKKWKVSKTPNWVSIHSLSGQPLLIYANMPLDSKEEMDLKAQDKMFTYLQQQSLQPTVLIHRGHSYHLDKTLKRLTPTVKLAILGSCGGYNKAISVASINPDVQIIGSKKTGAKSINDPIIEEINETLNNNKDLAWGEIWQKLQTRFSKDETNLNLFNEYLSPSNNVSLFVLKLFIYYNRYVTEARLATL